MMIILHAITLRLRLLPAYEANVHLWLLVAVIELLNAITAIQRTKLTKTQIRSGKGHPPLLKCISLVASSFLRAYKSLYASPTMDIEA